MGSVAMTLLLARPVLRTGVREPHKGLVLAVFLYAGFVSQTMGLQYTTPSKSAFITGVSVLLVPVLNRWLFKARMRPVVLLGIVLAFIGMFLLTRPDDLRHVNRGDLLTLLCAAAFALYIVFTGRYTRNASISFQELAWCQMVVTFLLSVPPALIWDTPHFAYGTAFYLALVYLGVACSAVALLLQIWAQRYTSAVRTALIFSLEPVFAAMFSYLLMNERLSFAELTGAALILTGVLIGEIPVLKLKTERLPSSNV